MLEVRGLCKSFGGIRAVDACSFTVEDGSITALIGPNGAGKTTAFNCISKTMAPSAGEVWLDGERIDRPSAPSGDAARPQPHLPDQPQSGGHDGAGEPRRAVAHPPLARSVRPGHQPPPRRRRRSRSSSSSGITRLAFDATRSLSYGQKKLMDFGALLMSRPQDHPARRTGRRRQSAPARRDHRAHPPAERARPHRASSSSTTWISSCACRTRWW